MTEHERWMQRCLDLATRGAGHVSPNPLVGAVLVSPDGEVLGEGFHARWGTPHAEVAAVRDAEARGHGDRLREATLYVNLEPCSHHGKTPPCADLLLERGVPRVVVAHEDPFPEVAGRGLRRLREAGVDVTVGPLAAAARRLNEAFLRHVATGRPLVTLKWAQTLDGQVATASGDSRWVSSERSRALVHRWRAEADAVLVGAGTARADDPRLTVRHVDGRQPLRVVLDRTGTLPPSLQVFTDAHAGRTVAVVGEGARPGYAGAVEAAGGALLRAPVRQGHLDLGAVLDRLGAGEGLPDGARPVQSVLAETGPGLATALLRQDLADRLFVFIAPKVIGRGTPAVESLGAERMAAARMCTEATWEPLDPDVLFRGWLRPPPNPLGPLT
ncbi:MAG: bifunctional diaminohydroxyphosphoribosylaminopyrimidine deaminase/5-amino-6-(5-phosphoribosylamino)uracil reductase RibD [Rubricoccaceae bacterium]|nr:bifunctional diaminohydroxyphosphoribosylaminopyrimidine deaminase/5-amino-6-(5-phosphoribosylamino)uracil reductase RibD [Rubricoccaceae bacterium]